MCLQGRLQGFTQAVPLLCKVHDSHMVVGSDVIYYTAAALAICPKNNHQIGKHLVCCHRDAYTATPKFLIHLATTATK